MVLRVEGELWGGENRVVWVAVRPVAQETDRTRQDQHAVPKHGQKAKKKAPPHDF